MYTQIYIFDFKLEWAGWDKEKELIPFFFTNENHLNDEMHLDGHANLLRGRYNRSNFKF